MSIDSTLTRRMTNPQAAGSEKSPSFLSWAIAAAGLLVYLVTLNHWVSLYSLGNVAYVSGWLDWQPSLSNPLYWLLTRPIRLLPAHLIPLALNIFSALCAALTLGLLARSVSILPQDRTEEQRLRTSSPLALFAGPLPWLPPLFAVIVCGFQLSFWEHATAASLEIFNLLLFAYVIRSLLEFRLDARDSWLFRAAFIYAAGLTGNWALLGFLPVFLVALVWLKGLTFFNGRFLARMSLIALAGLLFYLLLPLAQSSTVPFWRGLKTALGEQKYYLSSILFSKYWLFRADRPLWVLALPSLLPVLFIAIRWPAHIGDVSKLSLLLTNFTLQLLSAALLLVCVWVALDPAQFGPRHQFPNFPMLTLYYLGALSVGYFTAFFLTLYGAKPVRRAQRITAAATPQFVNTLVLAALAVVALGATGLLLARNLPQIRSTNGPRLRQYADTLTAGLADQHPILISDDPAKILLAQSALTQARQVHNFLLLQSEWLTRPVYQRYLHSKFPDRWPTVVPPARQELIGGLDIAYQLYSLCQSNAIYYLHPSFGYYFELFYPQPHGLAYQLIAYPSNALFAPTLPGPVIQKNESFWTSLEPQIKQLALAVDADAPPVSFLDRISKKLHLAKEIAADDEFIARAWSRALDDWGVQLQRLGQPHLAQAAHWFDQALVLNPDNVAARVNLSANQALQAGQNPRVMITKDVQDTLSRFRSWDDVLSANGPFDEPSYCFNQGLVFAYPAPGNLPEYHQAAQQFFRVTELAPFDLESHLRLAEVYVQTRHYDDALGVIREIHGNPAAFGLAPTNLPNLLGIETAALLSKGELAQADTAIKNALAIVPDQAPVLSMASRMFITFHYYSNALDSISEQLKIQPDDPNALYGKGLVCLQLTNYPAAVEAFTRVLNLETNQMTELHAYSLLYRAQSFFLAGNFDAAQRDYETLQKNAPQAVGLYKVLGDIAYEKHDTNAALRNYTSYLANTQTNAATSGDTNLLADLQLARSRLKELHPAPR